MNRRRTEVGKTIKEGLSPALDIKRKKSVTFGKRPEVNQDDADDLLDESHHLSSDSMRKNALPIPTDIVNLRDYNEYRIKKIKHDEKIGGSVYNESNLLRRISMRSVAETIVIRDDESIELENQLMKIKEEEADSDEDAAPKVEGLNEMEENRFGNIWVSLFWEEKLVLVIRYC